MDTRKPRVFVASTFKGFENERKALEKLFEKYQDVVDFWGYETWRGGVAPDLESRSRASTSDYLILLLGGRYGTRDKRNNKSITQNEYEEFLYSHAVECAQRDDPSTINALQVFEKDPAYIDPTEADVPGPDLTDLSDFSHNVKERHTVPPPFKNWRELQLKVDDILGRIPPRVPNKDYHKVSIYQFEFEVLGLGKYREGQIKSIWAHCPCPVYLNRGCEYIEPLHYRPPEYLRTEMQRYLDKVFADPDSSPMWNEDVSSFKTINIRPLDYEDLLIEFCNSRWFYFLGTNQAAPKEKAIKELLRKEFRSGYRISKSAFANNLGFSIAIINKAQHLLYYTIRAGTVSVHAGTKSTGVGTQLHAWDPSHRKDEKEDEIPDIFGAVYAELFNEARLERKDVRDLYLAAWGIGKRTGTPELLFICETDVRLSAIKDNVISAAVRHHDEFDKAKMAADGKSRGSIALDYELLADISQNRKGWEPESAVACLLGLNEITNGCISYEKPSKRE